MLEVWGTRNKGKEDFYHQEYEIAPSKQIAINQLRTKYKPSDFKIEDIKVIKVKPYLDKSWKA